MSDVNQGHHRAATQASHDGNSKSLLNWAGALLSVGLISGLGVWAYNLAVRDVSGVPVVRALEGPMRTQPDDRGGQLAINQGLAVNAVQAVGQAAPTADSLVLAPKPVAIIDSDQPVRSLRPQPAPRRQATPAATADGGEISTVAQGEPVKVDSVSSDPGQAENPSDVLTEVAPKSIIAAIALAQETPGDAEVEATLALAERLAAKAKPLTTLAAPAVKTELAEPLPEPSDRTALAALLPSEVPGLTRSLRPSPRPKRMAQPAREMSDPVRVASSKSNVIETDPASIPLGTNLVQLGAFDTADVARQEWDRLYGRFSEYLDGKSRVIQKAISGGRTFYRLRVMGFGSLGDARRFCSAFQAENAACIPVVVR